MKTETTTKASLLPQTTTSNSSKSSLQVNNIHDMLQSLRQKIKLIHVVGVVGVLAVLLGYLSVAPPTDLPNWPLYSLNARTWQFFERWGQHVKPYHLRVMTTAMQHIESRALYIITHLNIPDFIDRAGKPLSCEELKTIIDEELGYDPLDLSYLCRILHAAAHFDLLNEERDDKYSLTPLSQYLTSKHPKSLKGFVKLYAGDESLIISTALSRSIYSGKSAFKEVYRTELLEHLKTDTHLQEAYDAGTADSSRLHAPAIISDYSYFGSCTHICDIGGGLGSFLYQVLKYYNYAMKGTNFDLPDVITNSKAYIKAMQIEEHVTLVAGNFTEKLPQFDCDCYILKDILQNWSDEDASLILTKLHSTIKSKGSRVIIIENVLHTGRFAEERLKSIHDLIMMGFNPSHSRLRTLEELQFLLDTTGYNDPTVYPTRASYSVLETNPKVTT